MITDTGCSQTCWGYEKDFIPGSLTKLDQLILMDGVAGSLFATHTGMLEIKLLNDAGEITRVTTPTLLVPGMQCRLLSPQDLFGELWEQEGGDG